MKLIVLVAALISFAYVGLVQAESGGLKSLVSELSADDATITVAIPTKTTSEPNNSTTSAESTTSASPNTTNTTTTVSSTTTASSVDNSTTTTASNETTTTVSSTKMTTTADLTSTTTTKPAKFVNISTFAAMMFILFMLGVVFMTAIFLALRIFRRRTLDCTRLA